MHVISTVRLRTSAGKLFFFSFCEGWKKGRERIWIFKRWVGSLQHLTGQGLLMGRVVCTAAKVFYKQSNIYSKETDTEEVFASYMREKESRVRVRKSTRGVT